MWEKSAKAKKAAAAGKTYADKTKTPEKTEWIYDVIMYYSMKVGKCPSTTGEVYSRLGNAFGILHKEDPTCAIGNIKNAKKTPLRSPAEFNFDSHGKFQQYFTVDEETDWQFDDGIKQDKPRTFQGSLFFCPIAFQLSYSVTAVSICANSSRAMVQLVSKKSKSCAL